MKISVTSYSFWRYLQDGSMRWTDCAARAAEMGFDALEYTDLPGDTQEQRLENAAAIRAAADAVGLPICAYAVGANLYQPTPEQNRAEVERVKQLVDVAAVLGAPVMRHDVVWSLGKQGEARSFDRMLPCIAANAREISEYASKKGIRTCSENHGLIAQDSDRMERLFNAVAHDNYGLLVDVGNFRCVDEDSVHAVSLLAPYAVHVHAKDFKPAETNGFLTRGHRYIQGTVVGEGSVPVKQCLAILQRAGYNGYVTLEYEGEEDPLTALPRGLQNLRRYLSELEG